MVAAVAIAATLTVLPTTPAFAATRTLANGQIGMALDVTAGIQLTSLRNAATGHEFMTASSPLFAFAVNNGTLQDSSTGVTVDSSTATATAVVVTAHANAAPLAFELKLELHAGGAAIVQSMKVTNTGTASAHLRLVYPKIHNFDTPGATANMMGAVPVETGGVANLNDIGSLGMGLDLNIGLPRAMNVMEVASVYDETSGSGLFLADMDGNTNLGVAPLQFVISKTELAAFYTAWLQPAETLELPRLGIGVTSNGGWRAGVDFYRSARAPLSYADTPAWMREAGALYSPTSGGAGAIYLYQQPGDPIETRISSFTQLPDLLDEARSLGTDIVYLSDYWEGDNPDVNGFPSYYNKGDYVPMAALGGASALTAGISAVHAEGGRVIAYVEPFIVYEESLLAAAEGENWGGRDASGVLDSTYGFNYSMVAAHTEWQDELIEISKRLVGTYGFDGIFFDSTGWQMNPQMTTREEKVFYLSQQWASGMTRLVNRVRTAIRDIDADAVVLSETVSGPISQQIDGGTSSDLAWLWPQNGSRLQSSPLRYATPNVPVFSSGRICSRIGSCSDHALPPYTISTAEHKMQMNQVYAAGQGFALSHLELGLTGMTSYVRQLLSIRQTYKDAFVYGRHTYQPATGSRDVFSYYFEGDDNQVITVVNASSAAFSGNLTLQPGQSGSSWVNALTSGALSATGTTLPITLAPGELAVLARQGTFASTGAPAAPVTPYVQTLMNENFDDGKYLNEWTRFDGSWSNPGAVLRGDTPGTGATIYFDARSGNDFTYEADIKIVSGAEAGISFRQSDDATQGYDVILSRLEGRVKLAKRPYLVLGSSNMAVNLNQTYRLKVVANGSSMSVYVDGAFRFAVTDSTFASGRFGVTNYDSVAEFDNLSAVEVRK